MFRTQSACRLLLLVKTSSASSSPSSSSSASATPGYKNQTAAAASSSVVYTLSRIDTHGNRAVIQKYKGSLGKREAEAKMAQLEELPHHMGYEIEKEE